jgi:hypothetical protein
LERLTPCEGEEALHQGLCPLGGLKRTAYQFSIAILTDSATLQHVQRTDDRGQQIVEVMRDAAGQLAHGLHLLALSQRFLRFDQPSFGFQAVGDVGHELVCAYALTCLISERPKADRVIRPVTIRIAEVFYDRNLLP